MSDGGDNDDDFMSEAENEYEASKTLALAFVKTLRGLDRQARLALTDLAECEVFASKFAMKYLTKRYGTIGSQVSEVRKLAAFSRLWASHDADNGGGTVGEALARSCGHPNDVKRNEVYLRQLTSCEGVMELLDNDGPLAAVVHRMKKAGVPLNWVRLYMDLDNWKCRDRRVQLRWARDFHAKARVASPAR